MDQASLGTFLEIDDPSRVAESRRITALVAEREELTAGRAAEAAIVVSELATNLLKHAQRGALQITPLSMRAQPGIEILAIDRGPGMSNPSDGFQDGHSTAGTLGTGLGAVRRLSSVFDISSQPGKGTVILSQLFEEKLDPALTGGAENRPNPSRLSHPAPAVRPGIGTVTRASFCVGLTTRALAGEPVCGDAWAVRFRDDAALLMVADGLGHGLLAAEASAAAAGAFYGSKEESAEGLVQTIHRALRSTRGAAVSVARIDFRESRVRFAGLGNVAGVVVAGGKLHTMVSHSGTAGHEARQIREFQYPWTPDGLIVMHSDGLSAHWDLASFPGLVHRHPSVISGVLYREAARDRDDACVMVGRGK
jgi:anti-sigma regulatory factor (Ser/Thr protein kinase)